MHEQEKIDEAAFFLDEMSKREGESQAYAYMVSAFLSAARSVLQYAHKEADPKAGGQVWYADWLHRSPVLRFLKDKRNVNVHEVPLRLPPDTDVQLGEAIEVSEHLTIEIRNQDGSLAGRSTVEDRPATPAGAPESKTTRVYRFRDWSGPEDAPGLCRQYLAEIRQVVADGQVKGFLTP